MIPARQIVVGTAGHIDHGKTAVVRALSGINTDRLPEEQARGISIDLGFAHFSMSDEQGTEIQFGIVDVPGHERFIRNMVAGSVGIDLVLFVVAADDAVMPQSREHLAILRLLNVDSGIVVLTKTDLVSAEHLQLVLDEVRETVAETFLAAAPVVPVSSVTGDGIELLRQTMFELAMRRVDRSSSGPFRMPIDRVFTAPGAGCIVTGTVATGQISTGDELQVAPRGIAVRVRGLQQFGVAVEKSSSRQRIAVNLAGVKAAELCRGDSLVVADVYQPTRRLLVELTACGVNSGSPSRPSQTQAMTQHSSSTRGDGLRDRQLVMLYLGTREIAARLRIPAGEIPPGERAFGEIQTTEEVIATYGESFIIRRLSPLRTLGGGRVLDPAVTRRSKLNGAARRGSLMTSSEGSVRFAASCETLDHIPETPFFAEWKAGIPSDELPAVIQQLLRDGLFVALPRRGGGRATSEVPAAAARNHGEHVLHAARWGELAAAVQRRIRAAVVPAHPAVTVPIAVAISACQRLADENLIAAIIRRLVVEKALVEVNAAVGPVDLQPRFSRAETATIAAIRARLGDGSLSPPTANELAVACGCKLADLLRLMRFLAGQNELVEIADGLFLTAAAIDRAKQLANEQFAIGPATAAQLRDAWKTTRKFAVPLCEYLDSIGFSRRQGDLRTAGDQKTGDGKGGF